MATELEKLNNLISAIEGDDYDQVKTTIESLTENSIINLKNQDKKTLLHIVLEQPNPDLKIIKLLLHSEADINYRYTGPFDKTKQKAQGDNYLHIAARAGNQEAFLSIFKKSIKKNTRLLEYNADSDNPFHIAARIGMLLPVVKKIFEHLESTANSETTKIEASIQKAKEAKSDTKEFQKELREVKEKLKNDKSYIVEALRSKCALNKDKKTPLGCVSKTEKEDIKKAAGIEDSMIRNKNFHLCLYILGAAVSIAVLCLSLYFLFLVSQTFALSAAVGIASGAASVLLVKASSEIYESYEGDASMQDVGVMSLSEGISV